MKRNENKDLKSFDEHLDEQYGIREKNLKKVLKPLNLVLCFKNFARKLE